jgi:hypothetical protein
MTDENEPVLTTQMSGRLMGGLNVMGGNLVLTERRLVFVPLIGRSGLRLSNQAAKASQHLHDWDLSPQRLLNTAIAPLTNPIAIPLGQIKAIRATRRCALLLRWMDDSGRERKAEFAVFASRLNPVWNKANIASRDQLLAAIEAALPGRSDR